MYIHVRVFLRVNNTSRRVVSSHEIIYSNVFFLLFLQIEKIETLLTTHFIVHHHHDLHF